MRLERKLSFYEKYIKRILDVVCSLLFIIVFCWLYAIIAAVVAVKMGRPVLFKQPRPGIVKNGKETIFDMYKFRSMTDERMNKETYCRMKRDFLSWCFVEKHNP
jgi:lipopolysaccharide/colanic/teichoic acid biosynthesis glycosyltransferase